MTLLTGFPLLLYPLGYFLIPAESKVEGQTRKSRTEEEDSESSEEPDISPRGDYVTEKRIAKVKDILEEGEEVHYLTRGSTVDVEGSQAGTGLFGNDRSRSSGFRGWVRAVFTDRRVAVKVPQWLGNDEKSVPYQSITSVDLDTGLVKKRIALQTPGQTYHIEADNPSKDECREIVKFVRKKIRGTEESGTKESKDNLDKLEQLKDLHDKGALSDEEFEEKKEELIDDV